jgi:hypothetical protein
MNIRLHKNATTTPRIRALIQASDEPMTVLARRFGVGVETVARWQHRDFVEDRSHTAHRLRTTLTPGQEAMTCTCERPCGCRWTSGWRSRARSCAVRYRGRAWTVACAGTAWAPCGGFARRRTSLP